MFFLWRGNKRKSNYDLNVTYITKNKNQFAFLKGAGLRVAELATPEVMSSTNHI
jgi:hypothetical protein